MARPTSGRQLVTRPYSADEPLNAQDPLLLAIWPARRGTRLARTFGNGIWTLDIRLQGEGETVFLDI